MGSGSVVHGNARQGKKVLASYYLKILSSQNMKHLQLKNSEYKRLEKSFGEWLVEINYAKESIRNMPSMLKEFLYYLEEHEINELKEITPAVLDSYFYYLSIRKSQRQSGALHTNTLLNHRKVLSRFSYYLQQISLPSFQISLRLDRQIQLPASILSQEEIIKLYDSIPDTIMGYRDRAILAVYYGCGSYERMKEPIYY